MNLPCAVRDTLASVLSRSLSFFLFYIYILSVLYLFPSPSRLSRAREKTSKFSSYLHRFREYRRLRLHCDVRRICILCRDARDSAFMRRVSEGLILFMCTVEKFLCLFPLRKISIEIISVWFCYFK